MMTELVKILFISLFLVSAITCQKDPDESKPYEFGFTIDGQQHRHEKKDEKGIIQGEFGFITADGIYHVTVYATDENGKFKILSTRNLRISAPLDGSSFKGEISPEANKYRKQANLPPLPSSPEVAPNALSLPPPSPTPQQVQTTTTQRSFQKFTTPSTIKPACAGCGYVTTPKPKPGQSPFEFEHSIFEKPIQSGQGVEAPHQSSLPTGNLEAGIQNAQGEHNIGSLNQNNQVDQLPPQPDVAFENQQHISGGFQSPEQPQQPSGSPFNSFGQDNQLYFGQNPSQQSVPPIQEDSQNFVQGRPQSGGVPPYYQATAGPQTTNYNSVGGGGGVQSISLIPGQAEQPGQAYQGGGFADGIQSPVQGGSLPGLPQPGSFGGGQQTPQYNSFSSGVQSSFPSQAGFQQPGSFEGEVNPLRLPGQGPQTPDSQLPPVTVSGGVIHVDGDRQQDIQIKDKFPGMSDGLPEGIEEKDITNLLYKFHYFVGFHGHYEKGLKNGAKIGGYFVNGRDGISRVVTYVADENGYRPKVKFINLGLDSDETPKPDTEKTFGLKSFEFVWYPL